MTIFFIFFVYSEQHMKACEAAVYDKTALPEVQVLLTPPQIQNGITQLEQMIENMEQTILEIMGEYNNKLKVRVYVLVRTI